MPKLTKCKTCGKDIARSAKACPHCGAKNKKSIGCFTAIVIIVLVVITFSSLNKAKMTPAEKEREQRIEAAEQKAREKREAERKRIGNDGTAYIMAQDFILDRLKAPATAKFGHKGSISDVAKHLGGGKWIVSGYVDAQNSFGATIRTNYTAILQYHTNEKWTLTSVEMK